MLSHFARLHGNREVVRRKEGGRINDNPISHISHVGRWGAVGIAAPLFNTAELSLFGIAVENAALMVPVELRA